MRPLSLVAAVLALSVAAPAAASESSFKCPNGTMVRLGDRLGEVAIKCDAPTVKNHRVESARQETEPPVTVSFDVEEWTYNQGPRAFLYTLIFRNGALTEIKRGDYGR